MARTYIGVDVDRTRLHMVCLEKGPDGLLVKAIANRAIEGSDHAAEAVSEIVREWEVATPRIAAALPSDRLLSRLVVFPFEDPRKVAAAVPFELGAQLPVDLGEHLTVAVPAGRDGELYRQHALAVPEADVEQFLAPFDAQQLPLKILDLFPFANLPLLQEGEDAILVTIREASFNVTRTSEGTVQAYRQSPISEKQTETDLAVEIQREVRILAAQATETLPIYLAGSGVTVERQRALIEQLPGATIPDADFDSGRLPVEYLQALALARRAAVSERRSHCNLRQGRHAFRGNLAPFRRQLTATAILLALALVLAVGGFWFDYSRKAGEIDRLDQAMRSIYRQSFPKAPVPADVPLFMASSLAGLEEQSRLLGAAQTGPLQVLEALTAGIGTDAGIEVQEISFDSEGTALHGRAASFDAVDQLAGRLREQPAFSRVQTGDVKMSVDGTRVNFRFEIDFNSERGGQ